MSSSDPILSLIFMALRRFLLFVFLSVLIAFLVWYWLLTSQFGVVVDGLMTWLRSACSPVSSKVPAVFLWGALTIGTLSTSVIYLLIGRWWKKRATVQQYRGAQIDERYLK